MVPKVDPQVAQTSPQLQPAVFKMRLIQLIYFSFGCILIIYVAWLGVNPVLMLVKTTKNTRNTLASHISISLSVSVFSVNKSTLSLFTVDELEKFKTKKI